MSEKWTAANVPDLSEKVIIVTGGNSGIGYEAALEFARQGATTILACRSLDRGNAAQQQLLAEVPGADVPVMHLDLASQASVKQFAAEFNQNYDRLDILVNNAGIMAVPYGTTEDGFERQLGTNHLGHFTLTGLLLDKLLATPGSRVVNISSMAHSQGSIDFSNLNYDDGQDYTPIAAYGRSKLANLLFTYELQRRLDAAGADVIATAAHPGGSKTNLASGMEQKWYFNLLMPIMGVMMQSAAMGALPTLRAAVDPESKGGEYYGPDGFMEMRGYATQVSSNELSHDAKVARQLWEASESLTNVNYEQLQEQSV